MISNSFYKCFLVFLFGGVLSGCSAILGDNNPFRDRSNDYLQAQAIDVIAIPEDLDREALGQLYPVPSAEETPDYQLDDEFVVPRIDPNLEQANTSGVKIQRLGADSWILTSSAPSETWPRIRNFLTNFGLPTEFANASTGTIDTGWVELNDAPGSVHQFRIKLEQGVQLNTTEIIIQHREFISAAFPENIPEWAEGSDDADREEWIRTNLSQALASEDIASSASLLGQEIGAAVKVNLETPVDDVPYIVMRLSAERAWASIDYALSTESFVVLDQAVDRRVVDFEFYEEPPESVSWYAALFGKRAARPGVYYLWMEESADEQVIRLYNLDGSLPDARSVYQVLSRLRDNFT